MNFIIIAVCAFFLSAVFSPIESLSWWAGWNSETDIILELEDILNKKQKKNDIPHEHKHYIIYFSGIGAAAARVLPAKDQRFLASLRSQLPDAVIISDIFPYSAASKDLLSPHRKSLYWKTLYKIFKDQKGFLVGIAVNTHNVFQVLVSTDRRYAPIYNLGIAKTVTAKLIAQGYRIGSNENITIIGWSAGAQIAVSVSGYLKTILQTDIQVISIGGFVSDNPGFSYINYFTYIRGTRDIYAVIAYIFSPGRWFITRNSPWNRMKRAGKISLVKLPKIMHNGKYGYFGLIKRNGQTNLDLTTTTVLKIIDRYNL